MQTYFIVRQPTFPDVVRILWSWLRGVRPTLKQRFDEEKLITRLSEEMGDETEPAPSTDKIVSGKAPTGETTSAMRRRLGELMEEQRAAGKLVEGRPKKRVGEKPVSLSLADQGIDKHLADPSSTEQKA